MEIPLRHPSPNFEELEKVIKGEKIPERVYFTELVIDEEVKKHITENFLGKRWVHSLPENKKDYLNQDIYFWYKMGYDYIRVSGGGKVTLTWTKKKRKTKDTAPLSRGNREWTEEGKGLVSSWKEFEKYLWPVPEGIDYSPYEYTSKNLPDGMKMLVCPSDGIFETVSSSILGFENLCYLIHDNFELVKATFSKVGELLYNFYKNIVELENVGGFFQGDDFGYKTSSLLSPKLLKELVLPWHKKFAEIAHKNSKMYWLHCCGNVLSLMDDLIEYVKIDAFHSFQDVIIPVEEFMKRYGNRIAVLGGADIDKLTRQTEPELRKYIRRILNECMPGRYALGSGNSIANYVPLHNYFTILDEGLKWKIIE